LLHLPQQQLSVSKDAGATSSGASPTTSKVMQGLMRSQLVKPLSWLRTTPEAPDSILKLPLQPRPQTPTPTPSTTPVQRLPAIVTQGATRSTPCPPYTSPRPIQTLTRSLSTETQSLSSLLTQPQQLRQRAGTPSPPFQIPSTPVSTTRPHAPLPQPSPGSSSAAARQQQSPQVPAQTPSAPHQPPPIPSASAQHPRPSPAELRAQAEARCRRFFSRLRRYLSRQRNGHAIYALVHDRFVACSEGRMSVFKLQTTLRGVLREHPRALRALRRVLRHVHYAINLVRHRPRG
jgi:hypothetical protein